MAANTLYYGDNLDILRRYVKDDSVDLIYLDPPFNSNQNYNVLFAEQDGLEFQRCKTLAAEALKPLPFGGPPKCFLRHPQACRPRYPQKHPVQ